jgi:hypothetical protein
MVARLELRIPHRRTHLTLTEKENLESDLHIAGRLKTVIIPSTSTHLAHAVKTGQAVPNMRTKAWLWSLAEPLRRQERAKKYAISPGRYALLGLPPRPVPRMPRCGGIAYKIEIHLL